MPGSRLHPFIQERYRNDPDFRLALDYCARVGIPYEWFIGGEYEWSEYSRNAAIAYELERRATCPDCGTRRDEWNPKKGGDLDAYYAESWVCEGCKRTEAKSHQISDDAKVGPRSIMEGVKVELVPKDTHLARMEKMREARKNRG